MKIEFIEKEKDRLKFKMYNSRHTVSEMLKNELLEDKEVTMASYILKHPEDKDCEFFVCVKSGKDAKAALLKAISKLKTEVNSFSKAIDQLPKEDRKESKKAEIKTKKK